MLEKLKASGELIANFFKRPVTVKESFGFVAEAFRWLPRRNDDLCTGCGACVERCSSGATSITDRGDTRVVSIDGLRCIFCGRCAEVCPEKALELTLEDAPPAQGSDPTARVSLSRGAEEPRPTVDTVLKLQRCSVCGEVMPVTEKYLDAIKERTLRNLKPETAAIVEKDMERYLKTCINCRRVHSLEWDTHPRKFI
ncbi:Membrane bound hydrogenase subunit (echF-like) [Methanocella conradii HZ254]|uniref:Membrane bound hydrogenase subunit (EchF-like) n=1 Tax=Methanocella conradii (strain DSM 24694 / JCM 17849 / CGMCC 1.5162 / HZ254) TaxID=1041930 RepID=H8I553_METCZ|nr:4Fe-4S dicluster domain-containing protein [Methanocella conradii]AFC99250.1 Membrane bound hydrogenase subunit (echF-like) [Methanocella conradii HZ254]